ncbi:hypothetical protein CBF29_13140 [Vagococcus elongatus]|uniref:Rhodanese domain-containing protein n=2 Tax=Vagococcus elongatus TaxID=180344 RepID=A0A430ALH5_9ENTE|nr:hypothetical protein CBF29_13140 [Vagococcus elongatus]
MFLFDKTPSVSGNELIKKLPARPTILDIRQKDAYVNGHIPGAKNVTMDKLTKMKLSKKDAVYVVCYSGMSSRTAVKELKRQGYDAYSIKGGMNSWNGPVKGGLQ